METDCQPGREVFQRRQISAYYSAAPFNSIAYLITSVVVTAVVWSAVSHTLLELWVGFTTVFVALNLTVGRCYRRWLEKPAIEARLIALIVASRVVYASTWGVFVILNLPHFNDFNRLILIMVSAGYMSGGSVAMNAIPRAAASFSILIGLSVIAGYARTDLHMVLPVSIFIAIFLFVILNNTRASFALFKINVTKEFALSDRNETVNLLLNSYEDHCADWLWEVDARGVILAPSERFSQASERTQAQLEGSRLIDLFTPGPARDELEGRILRCLPFRDSVVPLTVDGEQRWWSLSAKERIDGETRKSIGLRGFASDVTATRQAEAEIAYLAHFDSLTHLPNRKRFLDALTEALAGPKGAGLALFYLDLDQFKSVNDVLGHATGDALLKAVAARLGSVIGADSIAARLGGDEFALFARNVDRRQAVALAKAILAAFAIPFDLDGQQVLASTSVGIAMSPEHGTEAAELVRHADLALYEAKALGRNRHCFYDAQLSAVARARHELHCALHDALPNGELLIHYQPIVDAGTSELVGYEALMRWRRDSGEYVSPLDFIPVAEDSGLIVRLGEWALREALHTAAQWPSHVGLSVNVSPVQIATPGLVATIASALAHAAMPPSRLTLEITESVFMENSDRNIEILKQIHNLGVNIALDDFGTGFSSLNYLRIFPFNKIKIDKCFVTNIDTSKDSYSIAKSIIDLARDLGMDVVAEGVENLAQARVLIALECKELQGYLYGVPGPLNEYTSAQPPSAVAG